MLNPDPAFIDAVFSYPKDMVCSRCKTNDKIHYNLFIFHGRQNFHDDPECAAWCDNCHVECELEDRSEDEHHEEGIEEAFRSLWSLHDEEDPDLDDLEHKLWNELHDSLDPLQKSLEANYKLSDEELARLVEIHSIINKKFGKKFGITTEWSVNHEA